jgi:carbon-monoxide dehydrogenase medium subunit
VGILVGQRLVRPAAFLHLERVAGLEDLRVDESGALRVGALVRHRQMERSPVVAGGWESLARTFASVASPRIRNQATVGGVLCDADYASDPPAMLVALEARVVLASTSGRREVPVESFITGHYSTLLRDDELLTEVIVPPSRARAAYTKFRSRSHEDRPCASVAVRVDRAPDGTCTGLRLVVGAVGSRPQHLPDVCAWAVGKRLDDALRRSIAGAYQEGVETLSDVRGSAAYRRRIVGVIVRRALEQLAA